MKKPSAANNNLTVIECENEESSDESDGGVR
jgi:hypothetical protein